MIDSFGARHPLDVAGQSWTMWRLDSLSETSDVARLPYSIKILLENLLRHEDGVAVQADDVAALAAWTPSAAGERELAFSPARVLMQDFTGVPAIVDLAAMRDAMIQLGGDAARINPLLPAELVIDHSVIAELSGTSDAFAANAALELQQNRERYQLLRWGQGSLDGLRVVPPDTGICHQVNLEYLARVVYTDGDTAYPDTLVGTDSHTPMVNGLGVLGWGVGGIEAEAALLGQPVSMLVPAVVGVKLLGGLPAGSTATDLVLTMAELLRRHGVVGKFVEFYGPGVASVALENRATLGNMAPEYGSTCAIFPIDTETLRYLTFTGRRPEHVALVEAYAKEQGLFHEPGGQEPVYSEYLELDLTSVVPSIAGPSRPQDRSALTDARRSFHQALAAASPVLADGSPDAASAGSFPASDPPSTSPGDGTGAPDADPAPTGARPAAVATARPSPPAPASRPIPVRLADGTEVALEHGAVVIAAITSCTNTSNPSVMIAAGLLARNAVARGLRSKPWVKTSLAPGSQVVMDYYRRAGLVEPLETLGYQLVGYGCTTCIGNSGSLLGGVGEAVRQGDLSVCAVLSGNRNFEGRIHPDVRMNYLASPPLVVAYALAGTLDIDLLTDPIGTDRDGQPVHLADVWPAPAEVDAVIAQAVESEMFSKTYAHIFDGDAAWRGLEVPEGVTFAWDPSSTYIRHPTFFEGLTVDPVPLTDIVGARVLALLGDSVTTDHISPAGSIKRQSPAGRWLEEHGVGPADFNSYGARRGNHEVMVRGTFANIRLRNRLAPGTEGGFTRHLPDGEALTIFEAAERYRGEGVPLLVIGGRDYGSGSSRDWAAKGTLLLGVRTVLAESFERIHRSNLVGMGVLPLQFNDGQSAATLGLTGEEIYTVAGLDALADGPVPEQVSVQADDKQFSARVRIETPMEAQYYRHGGILPYVLRQRLGG
jgi:aconitate hydratase